MKDITKDHSKVYEIGYLIVSSVAEEHVGQEADQVRSIVTNGGGSVISEEAPHREQLAYTMRVKQVSGGYKSYDQAYFGWVKFEADASKVEGMKKQIEVLPNMLRMILITTVRENTYLGKRAPAIAATLAPKREAAPVEKKDVPAATVEEMDKSIDEMVKEV